MNSPDETWYRGTADAIYQNIDLVRQAEPDLVLVFGADHIYRMNIREMIEYHNTKGADATVAAIPCRKKLSSEFGVVETDESGRIKRFHEKKSDAPVMPGNPGHIYASMGNYVFSSEVLLEELDADAANPESGHDFGKDILPGHRAAGQSLCLRFR